MWIIWKNASANNPHKFNKIDFSESFFLLRFFPLRGQAKILLALTPPPKLRNIGDHAQAKAVRTWLKKHFPTLPIIEVDKDQSADFMPALKKLIRPADIIFLHSGGNLGDRGIWSESRRRQLLAEFPRNRIISLPQTIYFSDTPNGRKERETTRRIYAQHPNLTLVARDRRSEELARDLFPKATILCAPDFALSLPPRIDDYRKPSSKALLCLRSDNESLLSSEQKKQIIRDCPLEPIFFDTDFKRNINPEELDTILEQTLELFFSVDAVVTDRLHGLIFAILCRTPCVVLPSIDHKIVSGIEWFREIPFVALTQDVQQIPSLIKKCLSVTSKNVPDWCVEFFDPLAAILR